MLNHMTLHGRLVRDPELKQTNSGVPVCSFTVAWSERRGETETKLFLPVTAWRGTAELLAKHFAKGREIIVEGRLQQREWTDNEGSRRQVIEMQAERVHFCGPKPRRDQQENAEPQGVPQGFTQVDDDELPF